VRALVLLNSSAGTLASEDPREGRARLERALAAWEIDARIEACDGRRLTEVARDAARRYDAVVAGGGDGTLSSVAAGITGTDTPLGVLPLGTLNHFAKDLAIPLTLEDAVAVIGRGRVARVDVGDVNGRIFLNNSSIGLYPHAAEHRDEQRVRFGRRRWAATAIAAIAVLKRYPLLSVRITSGEGSIADRTPFVFVGNNHYEIRGFGLYDRRSLAGGELCVYASSRTSRIGILKLALRAFFGRLQQARDLHALCVSEVQVATPKRTVRVALDGEVVRLAPPLHYRSRPGALSVYVP
jgi:diacylglycerol kinase family enzyme